ncbi:MAG: response regulator transcription factor [Prochlorothrix sp.]|nr:response regulator transcription factor [Prochlorothrix sp.]
MAALPSPLPSLTIMLVEPDVTLAQQMAQDLEEAGYSAAVTTNFSEGLNQSLQYQPTLIVIDRLLAGESGLKLCQELRHQGYRNSLLLMMAHDSLDDRVACLECGADDYLLKPYRSDSFLQLIRLYLQPTAAASEQLRFSDLTLDLATRRALRQGRTIDLTMKEFELLKYLMEHPREVLTREQILENVWGYEFMGESNVIEVYIRYLRLKIENDGEKRLIQTVRGVGYVLRES